MNLPTKKLYFITLLLYITSTHAFAFIQKEELPMTAIGKFNIQLEPQSNDEIAVGRMLIKKKYSGDLTGIGEGQMLSKRTSAGTAAYTAIEEFNGYVDGKKGGFTLVHIGFMSKDAQSAEIKILEGSGSGELENISGNLVIILENGEHSYKLTYTND